MKQPTDVEVSKAIVEILNQADAPVPFLTIADQIYEKYGKVDAVVIQANLNQLTYLGKIGQRGVLHPMYQVIK